MQCQQPRIHLPYYDGLSDGYGFGKEEPKYFYARRDRHILLLPPGILEGCGMNAKSLNKLYVQDKTAGASLTEDGKTWAHKHWTLYPFIDREQWDELDRPYHKYEESDEHYLRFVLLFVNLLKKAKEASTSSILSLLQKPLQDEILKRFKEHVNDAMPDGSEPRTIDDVTSILFSGKAVEKINQGKWNEVFGNIFNVIGSLTYEGGIDWLTKAINDCFVNKMGFKVVLAPVTEECDHRRHSITKYLGTKLTNKLKENAKELSRARFGHMLVLDTVVPPVGSDDYKRKIAKKDLQVVYLNSPFIPSSRLPINEPHAREAAFAVTPCQPRQKKKNPASTQKVEPLAFFLKECRTNTHDHQKLLMGRIIDMRGSTNTTHEDILSLFDEVTKSHRGLMNGSSCDTTPAASVAENAGASTEGAHEDLFLQGVEGLGLLVPCLPDASSPSAPSGFEAVSQRNTLGVSPESGSTSFETQHSTGDDIARLQASVARREHLFEQSRRVAAEKARLNKEADDDAAEKTRREKEAADAAEKARRKKEAADAAAEKARREKEAADEAEKARREKEAADAAAEKARREKEAADAAADKARREKEAEKALLDEWKEPPIPLDESKQIQVKATTRFFHCNKVSCSKVWCKECHDKLQPSSGRRGRKSQKVEVCRDCKIDVFAMKIEGADVRYLKRGYHTEGKNKCRFDFYCAGEDCCKRFVWMP